LETSRDRIVNEIRLTQPNAVRGCFGEQCILRLWGERAIMAVLKVVSMFFWTRSFFCIGAVVVLAEGGSLGISSRLAPGDVLANTGTSAGAAIERLCREHPARCIATARQAAAALSSPDGAGRPAQDSGVASVAMQHLEKRRLMVPASPIRSAI
jgi:hypothetical protein